MPDKNAIKYRRWLCFLVIMLVYPTVNWQIWKWVRDDSLNDLSDSGQDVSGFFFCKSFIKNSPVFSG